MAIWDFLAQDVSIKPTLQVHVPIPYTSHATQRDWMAIDGACIDLIENWLPVNELSISWEGHSKYRFVRLWKSRRKLKMPLLGRMMVLSPIEFVNWGKGVIFTARADSAIVLIAIQMGLYF